MNLSDDILLSISKPTRYLGNEWNSIHKDPRKVKVKFAFVYPEVYEIGMSNLAVHIFYHLLNRQENILAERVFAPWLDMEEVLRGKGIPLRSLETGLALAEFDIIGFSLQHELNYTNVLNILDLGGIPLRAAERDEIQPLIIAGGPCAYNPEPLADFVDAFVIGEGEVVILEVIDKFKAWKESGGAKLDLLKELARIEGVYVPSFYSVSYHPDGTVKAINRVDKGIPERVVKRVVTDFDSLDGPLSPVMPWCEVVHDRAMVEIMRGCGRGCRFCQAGMIYRPVREKKLDTIMKIATELISNTGYDELALLSLNSPDYSRIEELVDSLGCQFAGLGVSISLPSLRPDSFSVGLAKTLKSYGRSGLTFAVEAGTQRLRDVINKQLVEEDLLVAVEGAFREGWTGIKLYFMVGLPTESQADLDGIVGLVKEIVKIGKSTLGARRGRLRLHLSIAGFIPKPHTPFQWVGQEPVGKIEEKQGYLRDRLRDKAIKFDYHDARMSFLEAVFARGDRRLGRVLWEAWRSGCKYDGWGDCFKFALWEQAFASCGLDPGFYANRERDGEELLPWEHIDCGVSKDYLIAEYRKALAGELTEDCRFAGCQDCGVCKDG